MVPYIERPVERGVEDLEGVEDKRFEGISGDEAMVRAQDAALVVAPRLDQNYTALEQVLSRNLAVHLQGTGVSTGRSSKEELLTIH